MSRRNLQLPNKQKLLKAVLAEPGQGASYLSSVTNVPIWAAIKNLHELHAAQLIHYEIDKGSTRKRWYPGRKMLSGYKLVGNHELNEVKSPTV